MKSFIFPFCLFCFSLILDKSLAQNSELCKYVNTFIGTQKMGHTFPGACVPFGMVQLSPDTDTLAYLSNGKYNPDVYRYCAGYQYDDQSIIGFSHTHFSGTGHSDLGDFLLMPGTGALHLHPGIAGQTGSGYRSAFKHENEKSQPGYYQVLLDDYHIQAELTASERVGFHQYTFPKSDSAHLVLDLGYGLYNYADKSVWCVARVENDTLITGYKQSVGWARTRTLYFAMVLSKPLRSYGSNNPAKNEAYKGFWRKFDQSKNFPDLAGRDLKLYVDFKTEAQEKIKIKFAISAVSIDGAIMNLKEEIPHFDFEKTKKEAELKWEKELLKVHIEAEDKVKTNFYTAMYHAFISPNIFMDVDHQYKGLDYRIHRADNFNNYSTFSLWDTYRSLHPLFNIIQTNRNQNMVQSMLAHYDQSALHMLPIWSHFGNDNWCMSGYHATSVIVDALIKNGNFVDARKALNACVNTAEKSNYEGIGDYMRMGYVPMESSRISVSNTLEYAYDDWCIAQLAKRVNDTVIYEKFLNRSKNYINVFDVKSGFVKAKNLKGEFIKQFDALS
ncbi:MAG: GH92 family glycosyl hydrolase, partial [Bacteroidota bacterium]